MSKQTNYRVNRNELENDLKKFKETQRSRDLNAEINFWKEHAEKYAQVADESFNIW